MNADQLPLNQTVIVAQTEAFRGTAKRISSEIVELAYYDQPTNDETLKINARVDGASSELVSFDRVYWSVTVNGRPATESDLNDITTKTGLHVSIDALARTIAVTLPK